MHKTIIDTEKILKIVRKHNIMVTKLIKDVKKFEMKLATFISICETISIRHRSMQELL